MKLFVQAVDVVPENGELKMLRHSPEEHGETLNRRQLSLYERTCLQSAGALRLWHQFEIGCDQRYKAGSQNLDLFIDLI